MACPWLGQTRVKYCAVSPSRKLVPVAADGDLPDACNDSAAATCSLARQYLDEGRAAGPCPFFREELAEYCSAAPVKKLIPMTNDLSTRCRSESYPSCPLYLAESTDGAAGVVPAVS